MHSLSVCVQPAYHAVSDECILSIFNLKASIFRLLHALCQEVGNSPSCFGWPHSDQVFCEVKGRSSFVHPLPSCCIGSMDTASSISCVMIVSSAYQLCSSSSQHEHVSFPVRSELISPFFPFMSM